MKILQYKILNELCCMGVRVKCLKSFPHSLQVTLPHYPSLPSIPSPPLPPPLPLSPPPLTHQSLLTPSLPHYPSLPLTPSPPLTPLTIPTPFTFCDKIVVATHNVRLFIRSTNLRTFTARCLYFGFCQACKKKKKNKNDY